MDNVFSVNLPVLDVILKQNVQLVLPITIFINRLACQTAHLIILLMTQIVMLAILAVKLATQQYALPVLHHTFFLMENV